MGNNDKKIYNVKITCNGETIKDFNSNAIALSARNIDEDETFAALITSCNGIEMANIYNGLNKLIDDIKEQCNGVELIAKIKSLFTDIIKQGDK